MTDRPDLSARSNTPAPGLFDAARELGIKTAAFGGKVRLIQQLLNRTSTRRGANLWCCLMLAAGSFLAPQAHAGFVGPYALGNFSLINTNADGSAVTNDGGLSVILTGGNNGSGISGTTDLTIAAAAGGTVQFQFSYNTLDDPSFDDAGFLLDGVYTRLSGFGGDPFNGSRNFAVLAGHTFGFRVNTLDNQFEPAVLTISNFTAPVAASGVPEPATWTLGFAAMVALGLVSRRRNATLPARGQSR